MAVGDQGARVVEVHEIDICTGIRFNNTAAFRERKLQSNHPAFTSMARIRA